MKSVNKITRAVDSTDAISDLSKMSGWRRLKHCYCRVDQISHNGLDGRRLRLAEANVLLEAGLVWLRI